MENSGPPKQCTFLPGGENKAVVMISSGNKELEDMFHLACDEVYGFIRCYLLDSNKP